MRGPDPRYVLGSIAWSTSAHDGVSPVESSLSDIIRADIERYRRLLQTYRSQQENVGELERGFVENTKETERHLENVIRELEALLRDRSAR
jgi:hypothetical protein